MSLKNVYQNQGMGGMNESFNLQNEYSRNFNTDTNHPLIPNSQEYIYYKKYVSIHSEDRDYLKYPNSSNFEIELPEDMVNVISLRLVNWTFPANYSTFSLLNSNISMTFRITNPYNPNINNVSDLVTEKIFEALFYHRDINFAIVIEEGFYNPQQMVTELTNKFNNSVTNFITDYLRVKIDPNNILDPNPVTNDLLKQEYIEAFKLFVEGGGYTRFVIVYNNVGQKIWFGNICDEFTLTNENELIKNTILENVYCDSRTQLPDYSSWGLPGFLGLTRCNIISVNTNKYKDSGDFTTYNGITVPRFYYGDVFPGDNGFWLLPNPNLTGSTVEWIESTYKINLMGPAYMYMELEGNNCIDETKPYNVTPFTITTNSTNGIVNSSFAKISIPTTPISQWFDRDSLPYKFYYPPAEKIRRFRIRLRYHNGETVNFGDFNYSFTIEFLLQLPQILRKSNAVKYSPVGV